MSWDSLSFISLADLYVAYRKAKVDMFYERDHSTAIDFTLYEGDLNENLAKLLTRLNSDKPDWWEDQEFVGTYGYVPKSLSHPTPKKQPDFIASDSELSWAEQIANRKPEAKFRIVGKHPIDFHVVSALWLQKAGYLYDNALGTSAYGSRLRRKKSEKKGPPHSPSTTSLGSFRPYTFGFREWRQNGMQAIKSALLDDKNVIAVTADLRSFYHEASADYLLNEEFLTQFSIQLTPDQRTFTAQLVRALQTWASHTPDHKANPLRGLPVGLSAPRVIANVLLAKLDQEIQEKLNPLYYGRYVDDVLLVIENQGKLTSTQAVWQFISRQTNDFIHSKKDEEGEAYWIRNEFSENSALRFAGNKLKVFSLKGSSGLALLNSINRTAAVRSSDWRLLPDLPRDDDELTNDFVTAGLDATEEVDNLRKSDGLSIRRLSFALRLRNLESTQRDLQPDQWRSHRETFYRLANDYMVTPPGIFDFGSYLPRILGLAVACHDWDDAVNFLARLHESFRTIETAAIGVDNTILAYSEESLLAACLEAIVKAVGRTKVDENCLSNVLDQLYSSLHAIFSLPLLNARDCVLLGKRMYSSDLAREAFREAWLDGDELKRPTRDKSWAIELPKDVAHKLRLNDAQPFLRALKISQKTEILRAIAFPTRPFNPSEITLLDQNCLSDWDHLRKLVRSLHGSEIGTNGGERRQLDGKREIIEVPIAQKRKEHLIAVPCFKTSDDSWIASVAGTPDPDPDRYFRINRLINDVLESKPRADYLVLPELSLPRRWFNRIAHKLSHSGISLIAGLEYLHHSPASKTASKSIAGSATGFVANQVWASLVTNALGYKTHVVYVQEKIRPAPDEERNLHAIAGKILVPKTEPKKPVIRHGSLHFGILICSELTNLDFRQKFRGKIDALFVPEWNKDINSFSSFVESSALDIHCYVVQANNRIYGDCRIRAPHQEPFRRDVVRVLGGECDYFVVGKLDVESLRAFQSNYRSPGSPFKPTPDGFEIAPTRRTRPKV